MYNARAHTYIVVNPVPCQRFRGRRLLGWVGWNIWRHFERGGISRCSEISRKYGSFTTPLSQENLVYYEFEHRYVRKLVCRGKCWVIQLFFSFAAMMWAWFQLRGLGQHFSHAIIYSRTLASGNPGSTPVYGVLEQLSVIKNWWILTARLNVHLTHS